MTQTAEPAREIPDVETIDVVANRGYFKAEDIETCEKVGCIPYVPRPQRGSSAREGFFREDELDASNTSSRGCRLTRGGDSRIR